MHYVGVDISKAKLDGSLLMDEAKLKFRDKIVKNADPGYAQLLAWAMKHSGAGAEQLHFVLESSGVYGEELALFLCRAGAIVSVVNPAHARDFAKSMGILNKTDRLDARALARFGAVSKPDVFVPPSPEVLELKSLLARLDALDRDLQRENNRLEKTQAVTSPKLVVKSIERSIGFIEKEKAALEKSIKDHIDSNPKLKHDQKLLESIPGVARLTAWRMLSVIHARTFKSASQVAAYLGLVPIVHQSGSSVRRPTRLSKAGNKRLRAQLYMPAVTATSHNPDVRALYERLVGAGMDKLGAICAGMRKLVHICFGVLKHQKPYESQVKELSTAPRVGRKPRQRARGAVDNSLLANAV